MHDAEAAAHARHVDDEPGASFLHPGEERHRHPDGREEVDVHGLVHVVDREIERVLPLGDGGVVDEAVETAERVPCLECHRLRALEVAQVGAPHARLGRVRQTLLENLREAVRPPGDDADGRTPFRELWRERGADPRRRAGDENGRAFDLHAGASLAFSTALRSAASRSSVVTPVVVSA